MRYAWACSKCDWTFKEQDNPKFLNAPATCEKCKGDMMSKPFMEQDKRDYVYEVYVQCKKTGAQAIDSLIVKNDVLMERNDRAKTGKFIKAASEAFAKLIMIQTKVSQLRKLTEV